MSFEGCEIDVYQFSPGVLVVAKQGYGGRDWSAYIGTTYSSTSREEAVKNIAENGTKIRYDIAKLLFPDFDRKYKWRA